MSTLSLPSTLSASSIALTSSDNNNEVNNAKINNTSDHICSQIPKTTLFIKRLNPDAKIPTKGSSLAAGYDLYSTIDIEIPANDRRLIPTGLAITVPQGTYGRIGERSGLALKHKIGVGGGIIDADYNGEVGVILINHNTIPYVIHKNDRIAQLILEKIEINAQIIEVDELTKTDRGVGGFGSTGN